MITLERMEWRFTGMLPGIQCFVYEERLEMLGLFSQEWRRLSMDTIKVHKIMRYSKWSLHFPLLKIDKTRRQGSKG